MRPTGVVSFISRAPRGIAETAHQGSPRTPSCRQIWIDGYVGDRLNCQWLVATCRMGQASVADQIQGSSPLIDESVDKGQWIWRDARGQLIPECNDTVSQRLPIGLRYCAFRKVDKRPDLAAEQVKH